MSQATSLSLPAELGHYSVMTHALRKTILACSAAILLALLSVVSAHHMAPDRDHVARMQAAMAMGSLAEDLCGLEQGGADHRCPFCHKLPDVPRTAAPDLARRVLPVRLQVAQDGLVAGPSRQLAPVGVRAPPLST